MLNVLCRESVERIFLPPLMLQALAECWKTSGSVPRTLQDVIVAGEQLRIGSEIVELFEALSGARLHNHYGPTETHVVTALTLSGSPRQWPALPSIGRPLANTQIYILDQQRQPVPVGAVGELYIGGANLARGYLNRPDLTEQRFVHNPFNSEPSARMYRTGDIGRWLEDGTIEYLGRNDEQVKIRGYRIEVAEIEKQLSVHLRVKEAAVIVREIDSGEKRLIAYVTADSEQLDVDDLRGHLRARVPDYMVPSAFVVLDRMPLTSSGKLNRRALPLVDISSFATRRSDPPKGEMEARLARIWQELLRVDKVGRDDDFFELGGHSLLVLKAVSHVEQNFGCALAVSDFYRCRRLRELALRIGGAQASDHYVDLQKESKAGEFHSAAAAYPHAQSAGHPADGRDRIRWPFPAIADASGDQRNDLLLSTCDPKWGSRKASASNFGQMGPVAGGVSIQDRRNCRRSSLTKLGMDEMSYQVISSRIDSVYHCGTSMNHLESYQMAKPANVESARQLLHIATTDRPKLINYISTLGIFRPPGRASDACR